jgi:hypothetical protein
MSEDSNPARFAKPGCLAQGFLIGAAAIAVGAYLMGRWATLPGPARAGAVVLTVVGTLAVLPYLILLIFKLVVRRMLGNVADELSSVRDGFLKSGRQIVGANKAMYGEIHEYREATDADFTPLDRGRYESATQELAGLGFRHLGDLVDATIEKLTGVRPVIRTFASHDGTTLAGIYHLKTAMLNRGAGGAVPFYCDLETEFSDGTFLSTSNSEGSDLTTPPPGLHKLRRPIGTPISEMLKDHEAEKQKLLAAKEGESCVASLTLADAIELQKRQQAAKNAFRKQIGYVDPEEVRRIANQTEEGAVIADAAADAADEARQPHREP